MCVPVCGCVCLCLGVSVVATVLSTLRPVARAVVACFGVLCGAVTLRTWWLCVGEKPFKCEQCDYRSYKKSCVKKHEATHSQEKPFHCSFCDHCSRFKADLDKHERIHTGK